MKIILTRLALLSLCFFLFTSTSLGQTTPKEITDKFFSIYAKDPAKAIEYGFSTNKWMSKKSDEVKNLKTNWIT